MQVWAPIFGAVIATGLASAGAAGAVTIDTFYLTDNGCSSTCIPSGAPIDPGGAPYIGTVKVTEVAGALDFSVDLIKGTVFNMAGKSGTHHALAFNITSTGTTDSVKNVTVTVSKASSLDFKGEAPGSYKDSPFGNFDDAVDNNGSIKDNGGSNPTTLTFVVTDTAKNLTFANITPIGEIYLAADVFSNGNTGNVGAHGGTISIATPEPASWALMLLGVGLTGATLRSRRRATLALARV